MTNLEKMRSLTDRELASYLVHSTSVNEGDEDYNGDFVDFYIDYYETPNKEWHYDLESAIDATVKWLNSEI